MKTDQTDNRALSAHLNDLKEHSEKWHRTQCSYFLSEEEQAAVHRLFPESALIRYDGGYPDARKKKVIFLSEEGDGFSDIICMSAAIDQRFRKIGHSDILGALMHLQIDRHSFGDFWISDDHIYLYTSVKMLPFFRDQLTRINQLSVSFDEIQERPVQEFHTRNFVKVVASERADAVVAGLAACSRAQAKEMIRRGLVQMDHITLEEPDKLCNNNVTISIRGIGRFKYLGIVRETRNGRSAAEFEQSI
jgi:RNA-binding protein YlmH